MARALRTFATCLVIILATLGLPALRSVPIVAQTSPQAQPASHKKTLMVAMRDGTKLATDIYLPMGEGPFPVILLRTPYNKNMGAGIGAAGAQRGYAVVVQDTRGRFASEGQNFPFEGDGWWENRWDGYDTVEWIAAQPWCNGKIGTMGGSALGITQLLLAGTGTSRLACQQIHVGAPSGYHDLAFTGGTLRKAMVETWLTATNHHPDSLKRWVSHPTYDSFWRERDLTHRFKRVNVPALHVGGWYDIFCQGTIDAFNGYQRQGGPKARGRQKLLMGPWTHGIFQDRAGELSFPNAKHPPNRVDDMWRWFDHYLKGMDTGIEKEAAVTYYVMGDTTDPSAPGKEWRTADRWPPPGAQMTPFYFHDDRTLSKAKPSTKGKPITFTYDPRNPVPTCGGRQLTLKAGALDQRAIESRPDMLIFTSEPLAEPLEVTGRVRVELWASSDCPDTDFVVKLCDVYPDGRSMNVCEGILRARFREGFHKEKLLEPGKPYRFRIDLWSTSIVFNRGHRLRVQVTSSNAPGWDPNPNTGAPFRADDKMQVARNTVYLDGKRPSHILLPVMTRKSPANR